MPDDTAPPPLPGHCLNCGTPLTGPFCSQCGQREFDFRRSFGHMMLDAGESLFHIDGRITRGVVFLLFLPGRLTRQFLLGKRASQVPPLRFYLFITLVYFLTLPLRTSFEIPEIHTPASAIEAISAADVDQSPGFFRDILRSIQTAQIDNDPEQRLSVRLPNRQEIIEVVSDYTPKLLFALLPLLALSTRVLFWKNGYSYLEHLVVALHLGAFYFTFGLFVQGWSLLLGFVWGPLAGAFTTASVLYAAVYPGLLLGHVFRRGLAGTLWRYSLLGCAAGMVLVGVTLAFGAAIIARTQVGP